MEPSDTSPFETKPRAHSGPAWKSRRRLIDSAGLILFHAAIIASIAFSAQRETNVILLIAIPILAMDILYVFSPPKRKPILDPAPDPGQPSVARQFKDFLFECFLLLAPPAAMIAWFMIHLWLHQSLTRHELLALLIIMPIDVGLVSWIMYIRLTRHHIGVKNTASTFVAMSMMATWIGATFLFVLLLASFVFKIARP